MWHRRTLELGRDRSLHVAQAGEGPDLLLVHGALATMHDWLEGPAPALAQSHRVTMIDRPGHGLSERPRFEGTPRDQARQIAAGLDALGIVGTQILAHSFGCYVSLALAEQRPDLVSGLVLAAPIAFPEIRPVEHAILGPRALPLFGPLLSAAGQATAFDRAFLALVQRLMFAPAPVPNRWRETYPYAHILTPAAMAAEGEDAAAILPLSPAGGLGLGSIQTPTQILQGTSDLIVDRNRQARPLAAALANAELSEIEAAGHMLHHTHAEAVLEAVERTRNQGRCSGETSKESRHEPARTDRTA
jgi:pimeloyl-ACP methyl ester carboxylesterase